jgi:hypothetical protein
MADRVRAFREQERRAWWARERRAREQSRERNNSLYNQQRPQPVDRHHCDAEPHDPHCIPLPPNTVPTLPNLQAWDQWPPNTGFANAVANAGVTQPLDQGNYMSANALMNIDVPYGRTEDDRYGWKAQQFYAAALVTGGIPKDLPPPEFLEPEYILGLATTTPVLRARRMIWRPNPYTHANEIYELSLECGGADPIGTQVFIHLEWSRRNKFRIVRRITAARRVDLFGDTWKDDAGRPWVPVAEGDAPNVPSFVVGEFGLPYDDGAGDPWRLDPAVPNRWLDLPAGAVRQFEATPEVASEDLADLDANWVSDGWKQQSVYTFFGRRLVIGAAPGNVVEAERWVRPLSNPGATVVDFPALTRPLAPGLAPAVDFDLSDNCRYGAANWKRARALAHATSLLKPSGAWRTRAAEHAYNPDGTEDGPAWSRGLGFLQAMERLKDAQGRPLGRGREDRDGSPPPLAARASRDGRDTRASVVDAVFARMGV